MTGCGPRPTSSGRRRPAGLPVWLLRSSHPTTALRTATMDPSGSMAASLSEPAPGFTGLEVSTDTSITPWTIARAIAAASLPAVPPPASVAPSFMVRQCMTSAVTKRPAAAVNRHAKSRSGGLRDFFPPPPQPVTAFISLSESGRRVPFKQERLAPSIGLQPTGAAEEFSRPHRSRRPRRCALPFWDSERPAPGGLRQAERSLI